MPKLATPNPWAPKPEPAASSSPVLLLSQREAALTINYSVRKLYQLTRDGEIPVVRFGENGPLKYRLCDLEAFVNKNISTATAEPTS